MQSIREYFQKWKFYFFLQNFSFIFRNPSVSSMSDYVVVDLNTLGASLERRGSRPLQTILERDRALPITTPAPAPRVNNLAQILTGDDVMLIDAAQSNYMPRFMSPHIAPAHHNNAQRPQPQQRAPTNNNAQPQQQQQQTNQAPRCIFSGEAGIPHLYLAPRINNNNNIELPPSPTTVYDRPIVTSCSYYQSNRRMSSPGVGVPPPRRSHVHIQFNHHHHHNTPLNLHANSDNLPAFDASVGGERDRNGNRISVPVMRPDFAIPCRTAPYPPHEALWHRQHFNSELQRRHMQTPRQEPVVPSSGNSRVLYEPGISLAMLYGNEGGATVNSNSSARTSEPAWTNPFFSSEHNYGNSTNPNNANNNNTNANGGAAANSNNSARTSGQANSFVTNPSRGPSGPSTINYSNPNNANSNSASNNSVHSFSNRMGDRINNRAGEFLNYRNRSVRFRPNRPIDPIDLSTDANASDSNSSSNGDSNGSNQNTYPRRRLHSTVFFPTTFETE